MFFAHAALVQAITFVLRPTTTYRAIELDVPVAWLGALGATFAVAPLLLAIPAGQGADRFGERRVMVGGALLLVVAAAGLLLVADNVTGLVIASLVLGLGHLCSVIGQQAMVANASPVAGYDSAFGRYTFATSLGQAVGPGLIVAFGGTSIIPATQPIFLWSSLLTVLLLGLTLALPRGHRTDLDAAHGAGGVRALFRRPGMIRALIVSSLVLAAVDILVVYLPALGAERGIAAGVVGGLLAARAVASMVSRFYLGPLVGLLGRRTLLLSSIILSAGCIAALAAPVPTTMLGLLVALAGFGLGTGQPLTMASLAEAAPLGLRGRAMSLRLTGNRLGQVVVPTAAGLIAAGAGTGGVLLVTSLWLLAAGAAARDLH